MGTWGFLPWRCSTGVKLTTHFHPRPQLKMAELCLHSLRRHGEVLNFLSTGITVLFTLLPSIPMTSKWSLQVSLTNDLYKLFIFPPCMLRVLPLSLTLSSYCYFVMHTNYEPCHCALGGREVVYVHVCMPNELTKLNKIYKLNIPWTLVNLKKLHLHTHRCILSIYRNIQLTKLLAIWPTRMLWFWYFTTNATETIFAYTGRLSHAVHITCGTIQTIAVTYTLFTSWSICTTYTNAHW
jgi:hypothetical protein